MEQPTHKREARGCNSPHTRRGPGEQRPTHKKGVRRPGGNGLLTRMGPGDVTVNIQEGGWEDHRVERPACKKRARGARGWNGPRIRRGSGCPGGQGVNDPLARSAPSVRVPVLSSTTVSTPATRSSTSPPRSNSPLRAPTEDATRTAVGVARPSAQGQATTRTLTASLMLSSRPAVANWKVCSAVG